MIFKELAPPFEVEYVPGCQSILAHLCGNPSFDQYRVLDAHGRCLGTFMTGSEASELCWRYNEFWRRLCKEQKGSEIPVEEEI